MKPLNRFQQAAKPFYGNRFCVANHNAIHRPTFRPQGAFRYHYIDINVSIL